MKLWLPCLLLFTALSLSGFSVKAILFYICFTFASLVFVYVFLVNNCELEFEVLFKVFEWVGYGAPFSLESPSRLAASPTLFSSPDGKSPNNLNQIPSPIARNLDKLIENITHDFITTWYKDVGDGEAFIEETENALEILSVEGYKRACQLDAHYLIEQVIMIFHCHLERFNKAVTVLKARDPKLRLSISSSQLLYQTYESQIQSKHVAISSPALELNYLRNIVDSLLVVLLPKTAFNCDMGRFILREILAVQAVDLITLLSDSDWVNEAIIDLLSPPKQLTTEPPADQITYNIETKSSLTELPAAQNEHGIGPIDCSNTSKKRNTSITNSNGTSDRADEIEQVQGLERDKSSANSLNFDPSFDEQNNPTKKPSPEFSQEVYSLGSSPKHRGYSESFVVISSAGEKPEKRNENIGLDRRGVSSSLSSSWGVCPPSEDSSFLTDSFNAMRNQDSKKSKLSTEVKRLSSCCKKFEDSDEIDAPNGKEPSIGLSDSEEFHSIRSRSISHPDLCDVGASIRYSRIFQRSASVPCIMTSIGEISYSDEEIQPHPVKAPPVEFYGSPFYNISFCSSDGSFKSFNDDYVEEAEEVDEDLKENMGSDKDDINAVTPLPVMGPQKQEAVRSPSLDGTVPDTKTVSSDTTECGDPAANKAEVSELSKDSLDEVFHTPNLGNFSSTKSESSKDSGVVSDAKSSMDRSSPSLFSQKSDSDSLNFGDTVIMAGKKFISSIKSPGKTFGFSSTRSSTASTSTSSGFDSLEVNVPSSLEREPSSDNSNSLSSEQTFPRYTPVRKLSRSNAVIDMSSESDSELYGTPQEHTPIREEIVYGLPAIGGISGVEPSAASKGVVKIHPSQLITIPETEMALESAWEPGRSKFTLYKIEYDVRIWPNVYKALLQGSSDYNEATTLEELQSAEDVASASATPSTRRASIEGRGLPVKRFCKRRYREFMELHNRLCAGPLAPYMKDILKPNRRFNLPFGRLDKQVIEGRRQILQYYLVSLVSKPELRNSVDLQQFLGVITSDVSFIKPSVAQMINQSVHVPRVDKMLGRQMTKVFDSIKTAFDSDVPDTSDNVLPPPPDDNVSPWKLVYPKDANFSGDLEEKENLFPPEECFDTFLDRLKDGGPLSPLLKQHQHFEAQGDTYDSNFSIGQLSRSPWRYSVLHDDSSDDDVTVRHLGPRTAGDGSDSPDEVSSTSHASSDDLLLGTLGSKAPGACPSSIYLSASTGNLRDYDTGGKKEFEYSTRRARKKPLGPSLSMPSCVTETLDEEDGSHNLPFSRKSLEKLKHAADQVKQKKEESVESIQAAKQRMKSLKDEKLKQAAEEIKQKKHESLGNIQATKEKVKAFKTEKFKQAAQQVKSKKQESAENFQAAKEKIKSLNVEKLKHAVADDIHAAKEKVKSINVEKFKQVAEHVKEKKHESAESIQVARDKLMAMKEETLKQAAEQVKQRKHESMENLQEKAKLFKKHMPNPKIVIKDPTGDEPAGESGTSTPYDVISHSLRMPDGAELRQRKPLGRLDEPLAMSGGDAPSQEVKAPMTDIQPGDPQCPLSDAILNLVCEILKGRDSWTSLERVQQAFAGVFGGLFEWFLQREIDDLFADECWGLYLGNLNDVIWPNGKLRETPKPKTEEEKEKTRKLAVETLMKFFPDFFSLLVGSKLYRECAENAVESLQNAAINRVLVYLLLETFLGELIPELQSKPYTEGQ